MDDETLVIALEIRSLTQARSALRGIVTELRSIQNELKKLATPKSISAAITLQVTQIRILAQTVNVSGITGRGGGGGRQAQGFDFWRALKNMIFSTRVGFGHGGIQIMPLVGRSLQMLTKLGPAGELAALAIVVLTAKFALLGHIVTTAAQHLTEFTKAAFIGGGTPAQTAQSAMIGGAVGMNVGAMAAAARALQVRIGAGGDPFALGAANRLGLPGVGMPQGTEPLNASDVLLKALRGAMALDNGQDAMRMMRQLGLEEFGGLRALPKKERMDLFKPGGEMAEMFKPENQANAIRLNIEMAKLDLAWKEMIVSIGKEFIPILKDVVPLVKDLIPLAGMAVKVMLLMDPLLQAFINAGRALGMIDKMKGEDKHADAMKDHTEALNQNTTALKGIYGGGARAGGAIPKAYWYAPQGNEQLRTAIRLGALSPSP